MAVLDPSALANITLMCGVGYRNPLFGDSGDLLGIDIMASKDASMLEVFDNNAVTVPEGVDGLESGHLISLKLSLNAWHTFDKNEETGEWEKAGMTFRVSQIKITGMAEKHQLGVCDL